MWTQFMDMHSDGGSKEEPYEYIYIEASEEEAKIIFYNRFGHSPERVSCTCCGEDYSVRESRDLEQATGYERGCAFGYLMDDGSVLTTEDWYALPTKERGELNKRATYFERQASDRSYHPYTPLEDYLKRDTVLVIPADQIRDSERVGELPKQGYVWVD